MPHWTHFWPWLCAYMCSAPASPDAGLFFPPCKTFIVLHQGQLLGVWWHSYLLKMKENLIIYLPSKDFRNEGDIWHVNSWACTDELKYSLLSFLILAWNFISTSLDKVLYEELENYVDEIWKILLLYLIFLTKFLGNLFSPQMLHIRNQTNLCG